MNKFAHLHLHSDHSLLDGTIKADDLMRRCKENGMDHVAVTDHGTISSIWEMKKAAEKYGINYIPGVEAYVVPDIIKCRGKDTNVAGRKWSNKGSSNHLTILARDNTGLKNLTALMSRAWNEGFYTQPRMDHKMIEEYREGLIILSGCLGSELADAHRNENTGLDLIADRYKTLMGDSYFLEIMLNGEPDQTPFNDAIIALAKRTGIKTVGTNDCHYLEKKDDYFQDINFCVGMNKMLDDPDRHKFQPKQFSVETTDEICEAFDGIGQKKAAFTAHEIAENCKVEWGKTKIYLPNMGKKELLVEATKGFANRFPDAMEPELSREYEDRFKYELRIIKEMGYESYFLVVQEYIEAARSLNIRVGPGRGSGAGSLVAYCLGITDVDPIEYDLYFERFLNPHRVSMPDFDTDFQRSRRNELIQWAAEKYGKDCVAQIGTQAFLKPRGLIRDVTRVLGFDGKKQSEHAGFIPEEEKGGQGRHRVTLTKKTEKDEEGLWKAAYCHENARFKKKYSEDKTFKKVCDIAEQLESLRRHTSVHPSGVVIHDQPLFDQIPLGKVNADTGVAVTQFDMNEVEEAGYVKYDFLGLAALDAIDLSVQMIQKDKPEFMIEDVPLDDLKVFENIFAKGNSYGIFQFEEKGMRDFGTGFQPKSVEDLSSVIALYRPGPLKMGMVRTILDVRKEKENAIAGWTTLPEIAKILASTNGVLVYQEQVLKIAQEFAGFSLGEADLMRRAIGKKKPKEMAALKVRFFNGAQEKGFKLSEIKSAWTDIYNFSDYCFNKAHSICYAILAYQTAYLKHHYPAEFLAAYMTVKTGDFDAIHVLVEEAKKVGVKVLSPDINHSGIGFNVKDGDILFGLEAIKGVGPSALKGIFEARKSGSFSNIYNFAKRVNLGQCKRNNILALVYAGAFDGLGHTRGQLEFGYEDAVNKARHFKDSRRTGQMTLLENESDEFFIPKVPADKAQELMNECEALGIFLTGHPLDSYISLLKSKVTHQVSDIDSLVPGEMIVLGGFVGGIKQRNIKQGTMAFVTLGDKSGVVEVVAWPNIYKAYREELQEKKGIFMSCKVDSYQGRNSLKIHGVQSMEKVVEDGCTELNLEISTFEDIDSLSRLLPKFEGGRTRFRVSIGQGSFVPVFIADAQECMKRVKQAFPSASIEAVY